jgi:hypothetical protein
LVFFLLCWMTSGSSLMDFLSFLNFSYRLANHESWKSMLIIKNVTYGHVTQKGGLAVTNLHTFLVIWNLVQNIYLGSFHTFELCFHKRIQW